MITVSQPAARPWDGQRILRFLTGLAMLALAVTLRLPTPAIPVVAAASSAPAAVVAASSAPADVAAPDPETYEAERAEPEPAPVDAVPATVTFTTRIPTGEIPGATGSRAPPAR